ncbi:3-isopropylmalate dehydratase large subunit [Lathyrus oleraceus]|uniref:3-isopropylmalate dehydratase large subunit n=1 Tax=Pisum sativum TaxID=3888 RepID=A0A9D4XXN9_PEA|nr:3-isopropylmalate dehydratase large subunit [Pisum sativum]
MSHREGEIYLASPYTAATSCSSVLVVVVSQTSINGFLPCSSTDHLLLPHQEGSESLRFPFIIIIFSVMSETRFQEYLLFSYPASANTTPTFYHWISEDSQKILARAAEKEKVIPRDNIWVNVDVLMTHDVCGPGSIGIFKKEFGEDAKVWDREKLVNPDYKGVCHIALAQEGHCRPGEVLLGTDSHTCTAGAFGQFATGIGNTDAGFVLGAEKLLLKVAPTLRFVLDGEMPSYFLAKDLILQIISEISMAGATYKSMEFVGSTVESLTMEERMTLCNMVVEAGEKNVYSDQQARFLSECRFDVTKSEPLVAKPHSPDNRALSRECKDVKIDRVYIRSCTGGKTEDFMAAAKKFLASGKKVKLPTILVPATQKVWMDVYSLPVPGSGGKICS